MSQFSVNGIGPISLPLQALMGASPTMNQTEQAAASELSPMGRYEPGQRMSSDCPQLAKPGGASPTVFSVMDILAMLNALGVKIYAAAGKLSMLYTKQQTTLTDVEAASIRSAGMTKMTFAICGAAGAFAFSIGGAVMGAKLTGKRVVANKSNHVEVTKPGQKETGLTPKARQAPKTARTEVVEGPTSHHQKFGAAAHTQWLKGDAISRLGVPLTNVLEGGSHATVAGMEAHQRVANTGSQVYGHMSQTGTSNRTSSEDVMRQAETAANQRNNSEISVMEAVANNTRV
jgi:hypothetical protein